MNENNKLIIIGILLFLMGTIVQVFISAFQLFPDINTFCVIIGFLPILVSTTMVAQYLAEKAQLKQIDERISVIIFIIGLILMVSVYYASPLLATLLMPRLIVITFLFIDSLSISYIGVLIPLFIRHLQSS